MLDDTEPIRQTATSFWSAWCQRDAEALLRLWDTADPACSYLPAESEHRLVGAAAIGNFFDATLQNFEVIRMRPKRPHPRRLSPDLGSVFSELDWAMARDLESPVFGGTIRVLAVLRNGARGWRLCHYAEAPLAPLVELRSFYQKVAADGHGALG